MNAAVADRDGPIELYGPRGSLLATTRKPDDTTDGRTVTATRLSAFVRARVDVRKLDVQGAELAVLADLEAAGSIGQIAQMVVECHHHQNPLEDSLSLILALFERNGFGYQLSAARKGGRGWTPRAFQDVLVYAYRK